MRKSKFVTLPITVDFDNSKLVGYARMNIRKIPRDFADRMLTVEGTILKSHLKTVRGKRVKVIDKIKVSRISLISDTGYEKWLKSEERRSLIGAKTSWAQARSRKSTHSAR